MAAFPTLCEGAPASSPDPWALLEMGSLAREPAFWGLGGLGMEPSISEMLTKRPCLAQPTDEPFKH